MHGTDAAISVNPAARRRSIPASIVSQIHHLFALGCTLSWIASTTGVSASSISREYRRWRQGHAGPARKTGPRIRRARRTKPSRTWTLRPAGPQAPSEISAPYYHYPYLSVLRRYLGEARRAFYPAMSDAGWTAFVGMTQPEQAGQDFLAWLHRRRWTP